MSKFSDEIRLSLEPSACVLVVREAIAAIGWRVLSESPSVFVVKQTMSSRNAFTNPAKATIRIRSGASGGTVITLDGAVTGLGPIQSGHVRGQIGALKNQIEVAAQRLHRTPDVPAAETGSLASEIERLALLHGQGHLSDEEFASAKARLLAGST